MDQGIIQQRETNTVSWGNDIKHKQKSHFRILTVNINGLPQLRNHPKYGTIREKVAKYKVDIIGLSETNLKWNTGFQHTTAYLNAPPNGGKTLTVPTPTTHMMFHHQNSNPGAQPSYHAISSPLKFIQIVFTTPLD